MSRRVVVLLVVLGITVPYCALGGALWLSRGTGQPTGFGLVPGTFTFISPPIYSCVIPHTHRHGFSIGRRGLCIPPTIVDVGNTLP
jgi:hypothetical protein